MRKATLLLGILAAPFLAQPLIASADPPPWAGHGHHRWDREDDDGRVIYVEPPREHVIVVQPPRERVVVVPAPPPEHVIYAEPPPDQVIYAEPPPEDAPYAEPPPDEVAAQADVGIERGTCNRDTVGAVLGGVVGGVVGSQIGIRHGNRGVATVLGAVAGMLVGKSIGRQMDDADRQCSAQVFEHARNGQTVTWKNPEQGTEYRLTPVNTFKGPNGPCRTYKSVVVSGGHREQGNKVACRDQDGTWNVKTASAN